jgi:neuromedin U receptor 1
MNGTEAAAVAEAFNVTLQEYLESQLGVQTLPLHVVVPITALYSLISVTGIVGNVVVCMVIAKHPNMHTATNYYLFSLAVADVTILVFGETVILKYNPHSNFFRAV